jgi:hypothetical protein
MPLDRYAESQLRRVLPLLSLGKSRDLDKIAAADVALRLEQLRRRLEPEDEFSLILTWLGRCHLVHKLGQEQLPVNSTEAFRVPDLLAFFEHERRLVPVLIEVKATNRISRSKPNPLLSLKPALAVYAKRLRLPLLVAWRCVGHWILFDISHARRAETNLKIDFERAARQNLLGLLAGDVFYRLAPGTAIRMRIVKKSEPDANGGFIGEIQDTHFENAAGMRIPSIPHLSSLFMFWANDVEQFDEGDAIVQSFVLPEPEGTSTIDTASRTLRQILDASAALYKRPANLQAVIHDLEHWVHKPGGFQRFLHEAMKHGVVDKIRRQRPRRQPAFLRRSQRR